MSLYENSDKPLTYPDKLQGALKLNMRRGRQRGVSGRAVAREAEMITAQRFGTSEDAQANRARWQARCVEYCGRTKSFSIIHTSQCVIGRLEEAVRTVAAKERMCAVHQTPDKFDCIFCHPVRPSLSRAERVGW